MRLIDILNMAIEKVLKVNEAQVSDEGITVERKSNDTIELSREGEKKTLLYPPETMLD